MAVATAAATEQRPAISVVIPVRGHEPALEHALASVYGQTYDRSAVDTVVAVGPVSSTTRRILDAVPADRALRETASATGSTPVSLNLAIDASDGEIVARVDSRSVLPDDYLERAVETLRRTGAANVGGLQVAVGETPFERALAAVVNSGFGSGGAPFHTGRTGGPVDTVFLGVFDRQALAEVGGFNESLPRNQDYELNWRLREAGHVVWLNPDLRVEYRPRGNLRGLAKQQFLTGWWKIPVFEQHPRSFQRRHAAPPLLVLALLGSSLLGRRSRPAGLLVPAIYAVACAIATVRNPTRLSVGERFRLPVIYPTMHLSWGLGFWAAACNSFWKKVRHVDR